MVRASEPALKGSQALTKGDFDTAAENLVPVKALTDTAKAVREAVSGKATATGQQTMPPIPLPAAVVQALGFTPRSVADFGDAKAAAQAEIRAEGAAAEKKGVGPKGQKILGIARSRKNAGVLNNYSSSYGVQ